MIDLTPLDVRKKRGDFKKLMRGYDPQEVDVFLDIVAERLEALIRENMALKERTSSLQAQVNSQTDREHAVQAALVTAQELRSDIQNQAQREAENVVKAAETEGRRLVAEAEAEVRTRLRGSERRLDQLEDGIKELERRRARFLKDFRQLLEREFDVVEVEEGRAPLEERAIDMELGSRKPEGSEGVPTISPDASPEEVPPADMPVDQLAAAYEQVVEDAPEVSIGRTSSEPSTQQRPAANQRADNLLLYFDADDGEGGR